MTPGSDDRRRLAGLLRTQRLAVLATQADHHPYTSLVAFSATPDLRLVCFATTRATRKFHYLSAHPEVAMLIDSRSDDDLDFHGAVAATAVGQVRELAGDERAPAETAFVARHPHLRDFVAAPTTALLELRVRTWYVVHRFQNVVEIHFG